MSYTKQEIIQTFIDTRSYAETARILGISRQRVHTVINSPRSATLWQRRNIRELRKAILKKLGNKCVNCGFSDSRALQIDHVDGGGRSELIRVAKRTYYKNVLADSSGKYQLLCANCNWIKRNDRATENGRIPSDDNLKVDLF